jgi:predicted Ser/Thr protein kinase
VGNWLKGEKVRNPVTGAAEDPDLRLMEEVESRLGSADRPEELRRALVSQIAAWVIERPDEPIVHSQVFAVQLRQLENAVFSEKAPAVARLCRDLVVQLRGDGAGLSEARRGEVLEMMQRLRERSGYDEDSAADAAAALTRERFAESLA